MARETQKPEVNDQGYETHPAFGSVTVASGQGTGRTLFQSDLQHNHTVTLTIHEAERKRDLNRDYVHPGKDIVEIEMSLSQWSTLVGSMGNGGGTPTTIRYRQGVGMLPGIAYEPRMKKAWEEVEGTVEALLARVQACYDKLDEVGLKGSIVERREAMKQLKLAIDHMPGNAKFALKSLNEAAESTVTQAKADIEVAIQQAARAQGIGPEQISYYNEATTRALEGGS